MNMNGQLIETLSNSLIFQEYGRAYTEATGLPIALRPVETWQLPLHGKRKESPWCALMSAQSRTCGACLQMQEKLAQSATAGACTMTCGYGLSETAVPVKVGENTIGYLQTGQVMRQKPTDAGFERALAQATQLGVVLEPATARKAYFATPVVAPRKMESLGRLLGIFAEHLGMKGNEITVRSSHAESPVITRAKQFIEEHHTEDLDLGQVARAVHTSMFYYCKLFRKATGLNFTDYVSRLRTEKAKNLLLNPNLRISEIAYEVGFQSLTHFNRVFKKVVGQSPTEYRSRLAMG